MPHNSTDAAVETQAQDILLKAVVTTTDQGIFEAVISTEALDRENDRMSADGMVKALSKWPRPIPMIWEHGTAPSDIFGILDPTTVKNIGGEVHASGEVDLESKMGVEAWRSFKSKSLGFSFHFMILSATKNAEGGLDIADYDVFEITATRTPMNNGTYVVSTKSTERSEEDLRRESDKAARKQVEDQLPDLSDVKAAPGPIDELRTELATMAADLQAVNRRLDAGKTFVGKALTSDIRTQLDLAGAARFATGDKTYAYVDDFDPDQGWTVYYVCSEGETPPSRYVKVDYTTASDGSVTLGTEETDVVRTTSYVSSKQKAELARTAKPVDELRRRSDQTALAMAMNGASLRKSERVATDPEPEAFDEKAQRRESRDVMLKLLTGGIA